MSADVQKMKLLTVQETAALLRQSERSIRRKIQRKELPAVRLGEFAPLRVPAAELVEWLDGRRTVRAFGPPVGTRTESPESAAGPLRESTRPAHAGEEA
jgi:excisionase family DNA binding protein